MTNRDSKHRAKRFSFKTFLFVQAAHLAYLFITKFAGMPFFAVASSDSSSAFGMLKIFRMSKPLKVENVVIRSVKIFVIDFVFWCWGWANEGNCYQSMNREVKTFTVSVKQANPYVSASAGTRTKNVVGGCIAYLSKVGDFVVKPFNRFPSFSVIIQVSHGVDLLLRLTSWLGLRERNHAPQSACNYTTACWVW